MPALPAMAPPETSADTLEVRWLIPGPLGGQVREWFARFPAGEENRQDVYLVSPRLDGLSVKLRDGRALDVKSYLGSPGILAVPGPGEGRLEWWRKVSFPYGAAERSGPAPGWVTVSKSRLGAWFPLPAADPGHASVPEAGCAAELTDVRVGGRPWWTLALEATGSGSRRRDAIEHAVRLLFASPLPAGITLRLGDSWSYAQWLGHPPGQPSADGPG